MATNIEPKTRVEKILNRIARGVEGEAAQLPEATAADAGKRLVIDKNGNYALRGDFVVNFWGVSEDASQDDSHPAYCDRTFEEIWNAYQDGYQIKCMYQNSFYLTIRSFDSHHLLCEAYYFLDYTENTHIGLTASIYSDGDIYIYFDETSEVTPTNPPDANAHTSA